MGSIDDPRAWYESERDRILKDFDDGKLSKSDVKAIHELLY